MLTDAECRNATCPPEKKRARLACSGGLYLEISPAGSKRWFWKYRKDGKEARMALGGYPDVGAPTPMNIVVQQLSGADPVVEKLAKPAIDRELYPSTHGNDDLFKCALKT